jgi:antirestriction protein
MRKTTMINAATENAIASLFITNLGKYNEGQLVGEWIDFPAEESDINALLERIGIDGVRYEEYFVTDFESNFFEYPGEYFDIYDFNEKCEAVEASSLDSEIVKALIEDGYTIDQIINEEVEYIYYQADSMADVAEQIADECGILDKLPDNLRFYFDFEKYGRDIELEGHWISTDNGYIEILD